MTGFKDRDFVVLTSANRKANATHPERFLDDFCADGSSRFDDSFADQMERRCSHVAAFRECFLPLSIQSSLMGSYLEGAIISNEKSDNLSSLII